MCQSIAQQFISYTSKQYIVRATCFDLHWVILRPSKKTEPRPNRFFYKNALWKSKNSSGYDKICTTILKVTPPYINNTQMCQSITRHFISCTLK